jgi:hypothetical protein
MKLKLSLLLCFASLLASAQNPITAPQITSSRIGFPVYTLNAAPVPGATVAVVGVSGQQTYYYWASANYPIGSVISYLGSVSNAPNTLSSSNYISIIPWVYPSSITSVDILRTTSLLAPTGACNCAVATGLTSGPASDQSNSLSSYTVSILNISSLRLWITNEIVSGTAQLLLRNDAGTLICNLSTGCGGGGTICGGDGTTGYFMEFTSSTTCGDAPVQDLGAAGLLATIPVTGSFQVNLGTGGTSGAQLVVGNVPNTSAPYTAYMGTLNFANNGNPGSAFCYMASSVGLASSYTECGGFGSATTSQLFLHGYNAIGAGQKIWSLGDTTNNAIYGVDLGGNGNSAGVTITANAGQDFLVKINGSVQFQVNETGTNWFEPLVSSPTTYSNLPTCPSIFTGGIIVISDATTNTWGAVVNVGGGSDTVLLFCDGTNWTVAAK